MGEHSVQPEPRAAVRALQSLGACRTAVQMRSSQELAAQGPQSPALFLRDFSCLPPASQRCWFPRNRPLCLRECTQKQGEYPGVIRGYQ